MSKEITVEIPEELSEAAEQLKSDIENSDDYLVYLAKANSIFVEQIISDLRRKYLNWLMIVFTFALIATFALIYLIAFKRADLSENIMLALIGGTIAELGGMFYIPNKFLFHKGK